MSTATKFPTGNATVTGTWTNGTTGLNADDGTNATFTTTTKNDSRNILVGTFGLLTDIPSGSTINTVSVEVQQQVTSGGTLRTVIERAGVAGANNDNTTDTALTVRTYSSLARPGGGSWARDDLSDTNLKVRVYGLQPNNTTSRSYTYDYVKVIVDFTPPPTDLVIASGSHAQSAGNLALAQVHSLTVADGSHGHSAQNLALTQGHALVVQDASHGHASENVVLELPATALTIQSGTHGHTADNATLTQVHALAVQGTTHAHTVGNIDVAQVHNLTVDNVSHAHAVENLSVSQVHGLVIGNGAHAHSAENVSLGVAGSLGIQNATHGHTAEQLSLTTQASALTIQNALHSHSSSNVVLILGDIGQPVPGPTGAAVTNNQNSVTVGSSVSSAPTSGPNRVIVGDGSNRAVL